MIFRMILYLCYTEANEYLQRAVDSYYSSILHQLSTVWLCPEKIDLYLRLISCTLIIPIISGVLGIVILLPIPPLAPLWASVRTWELDDVVESAHGDFV